MSPAGVSTNVDTIGITPHGAASFLEVDLIAWCAA